MILLFDLDLTKYNFICNFIIAFTNTSSFQLRKRPYFNTCTFYVVTENESSQALVKTSLEMYSVGRTS